MSLLSTDAVSASLGPCFVAGVGRPLLKCGSALVRSSSFAGPTVNFSVASCSVVVGAFLGGLWSKRRPRRGTSVASAREDADCLLNTYGHRELVFTRGAGHHLYDAEGREYLDFTSGIAVNCLGHCDQGWAEAVEMQAGTLVHTSNMYLTLPQVDLAEKLVKLSFADKVFFCNSGTEANEAAIKFSRKVHFAEGQPREQFVAFENSFHGRTMGSLALTWKDKYRKPFAPLMPSVKFLKYNTEDLTGISEHTSAVFVEPIQGEGGVVPGTSAFLRALRRRCDEVGALLVFDEVQSGLGRSGRLFAYELGGVVPDMLTLAKPLAGGLPIGAVLLSNKVASAIQPGDHGSTFAGAPVVCAAANYTINRLSDPGFLANVRSMGERLRAGLRSLAEPRGLTVRGEGLLNGVVFNTAESCSAVQRAAQERGLLVLTAGAGNVLRILPALTVTASEVDEALAVLADAFHSCETN